MLTPSPRVALRLPAHEAAARPHSNQVGAQSPSAQTAARPPSSAGPTGAPASSGSVLTPEPEAPTELRRDRTAAALAIALQSPLPSPPLPPPWTPARATPGTQLRASSPVPPPPPFCSPPPPLRLLASPELAPRASLNLPMPAGADGRTAAGLLASSFDRPQDLARILEMQRRATELAYWGQAGRDPRQALEALESLYRVYREATPPQAWTDGDRALGALNDLQLRGVSADTLERAVARGPRADRVRAVPAALVSYGCTFLLAALAAHFMDRLSPFGADSQGEGAASDAPLPHWLAAGLVHLAGDLLIGFGGEWSSAVWREAGLDRSYNRPLSSALSEQGTYLPLAETAAGRWLQAAAALPFGVAYIAHRHFGETLGPPLARLGWGAAAAASGLWREGMAQVLATHNDAAWLDGSTEAAVTRMRGSLERLGSDGLALGRGLSDFGHGLDAATWRPGVGWVPRREAFSSALWRTTAAVFARGVSLVAPMVGRQNDPLWAIGADAWLALSWGALSQLPAWATSGRARATSPRVTTGNGLEISARKV